MNERKIKKVVIDASRGGDDIGSTNYNLVEKDFNLELSIYIYKRLKELGIPTYLTRENDETLDIPTRIKKIKTQYGTGNDVIVISNSLTSGKEGAEIIYALRNTSNLSRKIYNELNKMGLKVTTYYQKRLPSDTSKDYYSIIRDTADNESIIINYGNTNNEFEINNLKENIQNIGEGVVIALADYLNIKYIPLGGAIYHTVEKKDNLYNIAKKYNTEVDKIKEENNLKTNNLNIGDILKIPSKDKNMYKVSSGDSLYSIAKKFGISPNSIKEQNKLTSNLLQIGQFLEIPNK